MTFKSLLWQKVLTIHSIFFYIEANVPYYLSLRPDGAGTYIEYTLQIGYNCSLTISECLPYQVDAINCKCTNTSFTTITTSTMSSTTGDQV